MRAFDEASVPYRCRQNICLGDPEAMELGRILMVQPTLFARIPVYFDRLQR